MKLLIILSIFSFSLFGQGCPEIGITNSTVLKNFLSDDGMREHTGYDLIYVTDLSIDPVSKVVKYRIDNGQEESVTYTTCGTDIKFIAQ